MKSDLFEGYNSHCDHGNVDLPGARCTVCMENDAMLMTQTPFEILCLDGEKCVLEAGETYTALAVISSGSITGEPLPAVLIASATDPSCAHPFAYGLRRFMRKV